MAIETKVKSSNFLPQRAGFEFLEARLTDTDASTGKMSADIPLGKSYRSVNLASIAVSSKAGTSEQTASAVIPDTATVRLFYKAAANSTVIATFECEV